MKKNQIDIITLGCSKNLVDSELLMKQFEANGYHCVHDSKRPQGEIAVINTCGFIEDAKQESIDTILEFIQAKEEGRLRKLYVMGCLSQRYQKELEEEMPEVDKFYGKFNYKQLLQELGKAEVSSCNGQRHLTTPRHYAYIKIAEGCNRHCAYCAIPIITGKHVSRPKHQRPHAHQHASPRNEAGNHQSAEGHPRTRARHSHPHYADGWFSRRDR